jgi:class 3 adenylate cyclase
VRVLARFWHSISHYRIPAENTVLEKKRLVLINQMLFGATIGWTIYATYLLSGFFYLLWFDPVRYGNYFLGGIPFIAIWLLLVCGFFLRPRNSDPLKYYIAAGIMTGVGLALSSVYYGMLLSLEMGILVILMAGIVSMMNEKRRWLFLLPLVVAPLLYFAPKIWFLYNGEIYPLEPKLLKVSYFVWHTILFVFVAMFTYFIAAQGKNAEDKLLEEENKSTNLLLNILPREIVGELKKSGNSEPREFESATVLFSDFVGFTQIAESMTARDLVAELDRCFSQFDRICERHNLEKLKTIGDAYMCVGGIPKANDTHALDAVLAALEIKRFMLEVKRLKEIAGEPYWQLRIGIHTGHLVAGVIGENKFAYDVWGDTVNIASRMESSGTPGEINISKATFERIDNLIECEYRGEVAAKNKGVVPMYFARRIRPEFSADPDGFAAVEKLLHNRLK